MNRDESPTPSITASEISRVNKPLTNDTRVSKEQKECIIQFLMENPEILTHSSTIEYENKLWNDLKTKLNELKPEKSLYNWKQFCRRWTRNLQISTKSMSDVGEYKFKIFLKKLLDINNPDVNECRQNYFRTKKRLFTNEDYRYNMNQELKKTKFKIEIIENELTIKHCKNLILCLESQNYENIEKIKKLELRKKYFNKQLQKHRETEITSLEF